jgi:hypothetical protein
MSSNVSSQFTVVYVDTYLDVDMMQGSQARKTKKQTNKSKQIKKKKAPLLCVCFTGVPWQSSQASRTLWLYVISSGNPLTLAIRVFFFFGME